MLEKNRIILVAIVLALAASPAFADCDHSRSLRITPVDSSGITRVEIDASAGSLEIIGGATTTIQAGGRACASTESRLEGIELTSDRKGDTLVIRVSIDDARGLFFRRTYAYLDLKVEVPSSMALDIDDGSGSIDIRDVGALDIDDGSGSITIRNAGPTTIDDGSGSIEVSGIRGDLDIEDGSGEIDIRDVAGTVRVDDGSGSIEIVQVAGSVIIEDDGSGSIRITDVKGDLRVGDHGSGGLSFDRIEGKVSVRD